MDQFTYQQNASVSSPANVVGGVLWFVAMLAAVLLAIYLLKKYFDKKRGAAIFLQNQEFSKLVYNVSHNITGFDFEIWVKELLLSLGMQAETTPRYNDHGIDVIARYNGKKIAIQCKKYYMKKGSWTVGEPVVRDLYGAMHAGGYDKAVCITTGNFSREAIRWAENKPNLVLINAKLLERIILDRNILKRLLVDL